MSRKAWPSVTGTAEHRCVGHRGATQHPKQRDHDSDDDAGQHAQGQQPGSGDGGHDEIGTADAPERAEGAHVDEPLRRNDDDVVGANGGQVRMGMPPVITPSTSIRSPHPAQAITAVAMARAMSGPGSRGATRRNSSTTTFMRTAQPSAHQSSEARLRSTARSWSGIHGHRP
jgi:hypothetical protein